MGARVTAESVTKSYGGGRQRENQDLASRLRRAP
jgi:hypothetical protein